VASIELDQTYCYLEIAGVRLLAACPKCASEVGDTFVDWLEPDFKAGGGSKLRELQLSCSCGHEWEVPVKFTVGAKIVDAQPSLLDELDAATAALGRTRVSYEIWVICDLQTARRRRLWFMLLENEYMQRAVPLGMPVEIDDAAGYNVRSLTLPNGPVVQIKTHDLVFALAPEDSIPRLTDEELQAASKIVSTLNAGA
jgi:hypothetical protein